MVKVTLADVPPPTPEIGGFSTRRECVVLAIGAAGKVARSSVALMNVTLDAESNTPLYATREVATKFPPVRVMSNVEAVALVVEGERAVRRGTPFKTVKVRFSDVPPPCPLMGGFSTEIKYAPAGRERVIFSCVGLT